MIFLRLLIHVSPLLHLLHFDLHFSVISRQSTSRSSLSCRTLLRTSHTTSPPTMTFVHAALKAGNTAVITGAAAGGIGFSISRLLLQRYGMKVLLADISTDSLQSASTALIAAGVPEESFFTHVCDVSDEDAVFELADLAFSKLGRVDFLALNAGAGGPTKSYGSREEMQKWKKIMNVNLGGVQNGTAAFVQRMVDQGTPGAVVVTGMSESGGCTCDKLTILNCQQDPSKA